MLIFEKISYQNFLATGNVPIEIPLNRHTATLIVGRNGAGKSTMTEAVCFALFGRALRNINKPSLLNAINKRDLLVQVWLRIGEHRYHIKRGIKPNLFEIYQDGVLIPAPASIADYQTHLETQILGLNYKSFLQIVVLGSASYVPFMRLTPAARREIVEDILDIEIFSYMAGLAKDELSLVKQQMEQLQQQKTLLDEQRRMAESFTEQVEESQEARLAELDEQIAATTAIIASIHEEMRTLQDEIASYASIQAEYATATDKLDEFTRTAKAIQTREKKLIKEREFYTQHDECPTCAQLLSDAFKTEKFEYITKRQQDAQTASTKCESLVGKWSDRVDRYRAELAAVDRLTRTLHTKEAQLPVHQRQLRSLETDRQKASRPAPAKVGVNLEELASRIAETQDALIAVAQKRSTVETAATLLKDSGIKARLIKHYLPIINKQINFYLTAMDFPIHFQLDEQFQEHMQSLHRDDFTYDSFSEGEKKRIDLALLLTWRAVARLKNSASCNLLVLDEVFDSSLDAAGTEEFLKIIHSLEQANIFVISHKTDTLIDKFPHVLTFEKQRGFSTVK